MRIVWYVEDGYAGTGRRPHYLTIDDEAVEGMEEEALTTYIDERVKEAFEQEIRYVWDRS